MFRLLRLVDNLKTYIGAAAIFFGALAALFADFAEMDTLKKWSKFLLEGGAALAIAGLRHAWQKMITAAKGG